ncbi:MAG: efflux RND transporter periplasmic adaptor subunit [Betaproteobacteria bacterium]|nr:efflux RND transporter periplasmic adaptor subunit [Betaproteobacteria bacterium]
MRFLRSPWFWIFALVALACGALALQSGLGPSVPGVLVRKTELTQTVVAGGRLITPFRVEMGSVLIGTLDKVLAREGAVVKVGQVLAVLKNDEQRAALAQAKGALAEADAGLAQLASQSGPVAEEGLHKAAASLQFARDELARTQRLFEQGFFSASKLREADRALQSADAEHKSALAQALANRPPGAEYVLARARREQARAALDAAQARLVNTQIRAPADGTILKRFVEVGDLVAQSKLMFEMSVTGATQLSLLVDDKNLGLLALGQTARVVADAYPARPVSAEVFYIAPAVDAQRGTLEVKLRVKDATPFLKPDMTVSAEIVAGRKSGALVLPADAVRDAAGATPWVLVVRGGRTERQEVKLGLRGEGSVEIASGLAEADVAISMSEVAIQPGQRVRADTSPTPAKPRVSGPDIVR